MTPVDNDIIELTPKLPQPVLDAYNDNKLVFFIGAGISRLQNLPGWDQLAHRLITNAFTPSECNQILSSISDNKQLITIAYYHMIKNKKEREFYSIFGDSLKPKLKSKRDIYALLFQLRSLFVTTNCDGLMEEKIGKPRCTTECLQEKLTEAKPRYLFYIHGRYVDKNKLDKDSLVFTSDKYIEKYSDPKFLDFLSTLFREYTVLFLGYGLNEFELLDNLLRKANGGLAKRHYILEGFFGYEEALAEAKRKYYNALNVELIAYKKDINDYQQQFDIIKYWIEQLKLFASYSFMQISAINSMISDHSVRDKQEIRNEIITDFRQIFIPPICEAINKSENYMTWIIFLFEQRLYCIDLSKCQAATSYSSDASPNKLIEGLESLIKQKPFDMELHQLCGRIIEGIFNEFISLPTTSSLRRNTRLYITLSVILENLNAMYIPSNTAIFIRNIDSSYYNFIMSSLSRSSQFVHWEIQLFENVFFDIYCPALLDGYSELNYFAQQFFATNKNTLSEQKAQKILDLLVKAIDEGEKQFLRYLIIRYIDDAVFNRNELSLCRAIRICMDRINQLDAESYIYNGINSFKTKPFLCKVCINVLGKQISIPIHIYKVSINPWESSVIMYEWMKCVQLRSKELSASDYMTLLSWINAAGARESLTDEMKFKYVSFRKWQIAEMAHSIYPQFTEIMYELARIFDDQTSLVTIVQEIDNDYDDGFTKEEKKAQDFGKRIQALNEIEMLKAYRREYKKPNEFVQRLLSEQLSEWVISRLEIGDSGLRFYQSIPMIMNGYIFWKLADYKPNKKETLDALYQLAFSFLECHLADTNNKKISDNIEPPAKACLTILQNALSIKTEHLTSIRKFCLQLINDLGTYEIPSVTFSSANDIINDIYGSLYSLFLDCVFARANINNPSQKILPEDKAVIQRPSTTLRYVLAMHLSQFYSMDMEWTIELLDVVFGLDQHTIALVSIGTGFSNQIFRPTTRYIVDNELLAFWDEQKEKADKSNNLRISLFSYMGIAFYYDQISQEEALILLKTIPIEKAVEFISGISSDMSIIYEAETLTVKVKQLKIIIDELSELGINKKPLYAALVRIMITRNQLTNDIVKICTDCIRDIDGCPANHDIELIEANNKVDIFTWYEYYLTIVKYVGCYFSFDEIRNIFLAFQKGGIPKNKLEEFLNASFTQDRINGDVFYKLLEEMEQ